MTVAPNLLYGQIASSGAQTRPANRSAAVSPDIVSVEFGPYRTEQLCNVNRDSVSQDDPPPLVLRPCFLVRPGEWVFIAEYEVSLPPYSGGEPVPGGGGCPGPG